MTWRDQAACLDTPTEMFFPTVQVGKNHDWSAPAALCASCPVLQECRTDVMAVEHDMARMMRYGFVGGLTPEQRYRLDQRKGRELSAFEALREPRRSPGGACGRGKRPTPRAAEDVA